MASNGVNPSTGHPLFPEEDALQLGADLEEVGAFAAARGIAGRGTTTQMNAFGYPLEGHLWVNTTDGTVYRRTASSGWVPAVRGDADWANASLVNSFTAPTYTIRYTRINGVVHLAGRLGRASAPTSFTTAFTLPAGFRPGSPVRRPLRVDLSGILVVNPSGDVQAQWATGNEVGELTGICFVAEG